ncbi:acyl-CoA thioesterase-2 [Bradyrhizobium brasilense]|uniref:Acyl-CoA thioesterase 2 n=1 Tax=Bradyrhizobium brasilense TaxID=1419277 RepID=A0A1G6U8V9_9BRAD|nr:acyl-CoA thioesterase II [Bradyrhizobium brasilense]SDD37721.1 acyl-CoA thioesterase-2 [Bradyrhizobium brasilense]
MSNTLANLLAILNLEQRDLNLFFGNVLRTGSPRVFGGQLIGQAIAAACRTVKDRLPHSIHGYFLKAGDPQVPIIYQVETLHEDESYSSRRVAAIQCHEMIFSIMASFQGEEHGAFDHQGTMPDVPSPDKLTSEKLANQPMLVETPEFIRRHYGIELLAVETERYFGHKFDDGRIHIWIKTAMKLPDDPALHICALGYASDYSLLDAVTARYGRKPFDSRVILASLDHAMWFHRPFRADDWLLYAHDSPSAERGRGITRGLIFKPDGTLVASVAQEGAVRERP